jgi:hypothetical protein
VEDTESARRRRRGFALSRWKSFLIAFGDFYL